MKSIYLFILIFLLTHHQNHSATPPPTTTTTNQFYKKFNLNKKFIQLQNLNLKFKILLNPDVANLNRREELIFDNYELESIYELNNVKEKKSSTPVILPQTTFNNAASIDYVRSKLVKINLIYRTRYEFNFELSLLNPKNAELIFDKSLKFKFSFIKSVGDSINNENHNIVIDHYFYVIDIVSNELIDKLSILPSIKSKFDSNNEEVIAVNMAAATQNIDLNLDDNGDDDLTYYYFNSFIERFATRNQLLLETADGSSDLTIDLNKFQRVLELNSFLLNGNFNDTSNIFNQTSISDYTIGCIDPIYPDSDTRAIMYGEDDYDDRHLCKLNLFNLLIINDLNYLKVQLNKNLFDYKFKLNYLNLILYIRKTINIYNKLEIPNIVYINVRINLLIDRKMNINLLSYIQSIQRKISVKKRQQQQQQQQQDKSQQFSNGNDEDNISYEVNTGVNVGHKSQTFYSNVLSPLQLVINEDTIGIQTQAKLYDYVWFDYQLNASDYVKERIQLLDNSMLNISKRFDYETGGAIHTFHVIFLRKLDKRTIREIKPITIKVLDINDESPVWKMDEPIPYTAVVERDPRPGQLVFQFIAEDPDSQSEIVYQLHSKSPNTSRLVMKDGKIMTESGPPFQHNAYKILVSAYDAKAYNKYQSSSEFNNKTQEIFAELMVYVGKRAPQFYQSEYKINISESAPIGFHVANMRAKSFNPDLTNKKHLRYSLLTKQDQLSAEFSIYSDNGTVMLARKVDYETDLREFNLIVYVSEQSGWLFTSSAKLNVYIEDANDNSPQFTLSEYVCNQQISEDVSPDTLIIQVEVQDRDSGMNGEMQWQVSNPNFYVKPFSDSDTKRAKIYNRGKLDYEIAQHAYKFDVIACDRGTPSLCATAKVSVPMSNVNDEKPKFDQKVILATLDENVPSGAYVTTIQATDGDGDRVFFKLKDESGPFEINRDSGIVKIKADRRIDPKEDYYNLTIYAEDDGSCCCGNGYGKSQKYAANCKIKTNREEATLVIKIRDINDHAPKFDNCEAYSRIAQVEEEKPIGTNVTQVRARDDDKGENGEVEYEILSTHNPNSNDRNNIPFKIDSRTGLITTNMIFDRESNGKYLSEYSITVKAKDKGKPHPLSDACSFRIKIVDINDHAPVFYETEYKLSMKYGAIAGQNIQRIIANDLDSGKNAEIKYRIDPNSDYAKYFHADEMTGMISLRKVLPNNVRLPIQISLIAEDNGSPSLSTSVPVIVSFADRDNEPPRWLPETEKRFERVLRIPEAISLNQVVETLEAESNYAPNSKLIFDFSPKPQPESFIIQQERIGLTNRYRGKIIVYQPLDAETKSFYELHVRVQNAAAQPMEITGVVKVEILDSNDNIPLFTSPTYLANVSENSPPGTYVTKVTAEDKDIYSPNNLVIYTINDPEHNRKFQIDSATGNITTRVVLDREETKVFFIDVTACDSAMSDRPNMNTPNCRTANVRIDVSDTNDNPPYFNSTLYQANVYENAERGTPILTIQANDRDENSQLRYIITDGNEANVFGVRETIGEIYVANNGKLDFETLDEYLLTLTVSDGIHNATTKVRITLIDVNDNPPVFTEQPPYEIELVEEDMNYPRVILKINATDGDIKRPNTIVYKINYNYTQNSTSFRPFNIIPTTGEIILQEKLDRDYPNGRPVWSFNVIASDEGGNKGSMDSTAVVNVRLIDINDNAPVFDRPPYIGHIMENSKIGSLIMTVTANDYDDPNTGQNAVLRYQIAENKKFGNIDIFSINDTTGQIFQNVMLDREQIDKYTIEVCATDGSSKRGCGQVTIYVDDANDQAPVFQSNTYTETINEDLGIGERVLMVTAIDKDIGVNAELSYGLKSECLVRNGVYTGNDATDCVGGIHEPKYFKVDTEREVNSGFVKLAKNVNFDPPDFHRLFKLNVSVSDGVAQNFSTVFINIADVNDEAPMFKEPVKNIKIYESIAPLTLITNFTAEDLDTNEMNRRFSYSIDRKSEGSHEFTIDQTGSVYNLETLDRETKDKYILRIFAIDEGYPPQTGIATLNIELIDVNDNFPIFADNYKPMIYENSPPGQFVATIFGKDLDDPKNGPPFKFSLPDQLTVWPSKKDGSKFNMSFNLDDLNGDNSATIFSLVTFDRESKDCRPKVNSKSLPLKNEMNEEFNCKEYKIPITMSDSGKPPMSGVNYLTVIIGDVNDNFHYPGVKTIVVYDYKGSVTRPNSKRPTFHIGTVYSEDKDDWDLVDKIFTFKENTDDYIRKNFEIIESENYISNLVSTNNGGTHHAHPPGSIIVKSGVKLGTYGFHVYVRDRTRPNYETQVSTVSITIRAINDDAIQNSGSIRISGISAERLIETRYSSNERSYLDDIRTFLASKIFKIDSETNIDIFSIMNHKYQPLTVDLRYSIHGSPYHKAIRLNGLLAHNRTQFQRMLTTLDLGLKIVSIGIDECADSEKRCKDGGCTSFTNFLTIPTVINANKTAFVGVTAHEHTDCVCKSNRNLYGNKILSNNHCNDRNYCLNGGVCNNNSPITKCRCPPGFDGPRCQKTIHHFNVSGGFAWVPAFPQCQDFILSIEFNTNTPRGLLFYNGPIVSDTTQSQHDYLSLQLDKGKILLNLKHGPIMKPHTFILNNHGRALNDGHWHRVDIYKTGFKYRIAIDRCQDDPGISKTQDKMSLLSTLSSLYAINYTISGCEHEIQLDIHDIFVNINYNYPMQLGGVYDKRYLPKLFDYKGNFVGCIRNLKYNGDLYDLEINTSKTVGFSANSMSSCPKIDRICNDSGLCVNGICEVDNEKATCSCKPGYRGKNCELKTQAFDFQTPAINKRAGSYLKYRYVYQSDFRNSAYEGYLKKFTKIQLLFRTRENTTDKIQTLFQITSPNRAQFIYLEIANNRIQFRYDIGGGENLLILSHVPINDGKWHLVKAERFGKESYLTIDDGEGLKMNYTFGLPNAGREMEIDRDSIFLGAKVVQIKVSGYEVSRDYHDSCMMDVRFDDKPLPYTVQEERLYEDIAIKMETINVKDDCASTDYCTGIFCGSKQVCVDSWRLGECQCPKGQHFNGSNCVDSSDCQLCLPEGTKYCEKYNDDNQIQLISYDNFFNEYSHQQNMHDEQHTEEFPPKSWYLNKQSYNRQKSYQISLNDEDSNSLDQSNLLSEYRCICRSGYYDVYCNTQKIIGKPTALLSFEALITILSCLVVLLVLILVCVAYTKSKQPPPKHYMLGVDPNDEVRETIINYVEEGCPDVDQSAYDIMQLAKPINPSMTLSTTSHPMTSNTNTLAIDEEFQPAIPKQKPPIQELQIIRRDVPPVVEVHKLPSMKPLRSHNPNVGDFINSKLREIDNDPAQPPYDSIQEYAYEGEGSVIGLSLSSIDIALAKEFADIKPIRKARISYKPEADELDNIDGDDMEDEDEDELDLDYLNKLGPKFSKISNLYSGVSFIEDKQLKEDDQKGEKIS